VHQGFRNVTTSPSREPGPVEEGALSTELLLRLHDVMLRARCLEERLIRMNKQGDGFFWVGGPGEEALNASLGLLIHKGQGPLYDYLHFHYRSTATLAAMGADPVDVMRQMKNTATDPFSAGRNFVNHYSMRQWNVVPVSSPIEVQFTMAPGTAMANKRANGGAGRGITIVTGGDAGTAEGDFATCLQWCARPGQELPCLMIVENNRWGISTLTEGQHAERHIADRCKAFGIKSAVIDGNDPEIAYREVKRAMDYVRSERRPFLLEAMVSRLYGHSSASGANFVPDEVDCLVAFEKKLEDRKILTRQAMDELRAKYTEQLLEASKRVREEPQPRGETIWEHVFAETNLVGETAHEESNGADPGGARNGSH
jgi:2-oxoisovalerate dehydrogenase E1 component alpha subunit